MSVLDRSIVLVTTEAENPLDTLPEACMELRGYSERVVNSGDTVVYEVPLTHGDFYFSHWEGDIDESCLINHHSITYTPNCDDLKYRNFVAKYERIPVDTVSLSTIIVHTPEGDDYEDTCSYYTVTGYLDSIDQYTYTYKKFADKPVVVYLNLCDGRRFIEWQSPDTTYDGESEPVCIIEREPKVDPATFQSGNTHLNPYVDYWPQLCYNSRFVVHVEYHDHDKPDNNIDVRTVFQTLQINGVNIVLNGTKTDATGSIDFPQIPLTGNLVAEIGDEDYEISWYQAKVGPSGGTMGLYDFDGRVGYNLSTQYSTSTYMYNCTNYMTLLIRRKVCKYEYEITVTHNGQNVRVPSSNILTIRSNPHPSKKINKNIGFREMESGNLRLDYTYPLREWGTDEDGQNIVTKMTYTVYYYHGQEIEIYPTVNESYGYTINEWNDAAGYTSGPLKPGDDQIIMVTMDEDKKSNHIFSSGFRLNYISIYRTRRWKDNTDESDGDQPPDPTKLWIKYSPDPEDGQVPTGYDKWRNNTERMNSGMGLHFQMPYHPQHIREYHKYTSKIRFGFSDAVDPSTLPKNIIIKDVYLKSTNKRPDNVSFVSDYGVRFKPPYSIDRYNAELLENGRVAEILLRTDENDEDERWMCHMQSFQIQINNYVNSQNRIKNESDEPLANLQRQLDNPNNFNGITALPGLLVKGFVFTNHGDDGDKWFLGKAGVPDVNIHEITGLRETGAYVNTDDPDAWGHDEEGRITYNVETLRYPESVDEKDLGVGDYFTDERPLIIVDQLKQNTHIHSTFHWIDYNNGTLVDKFAEILEDIKDSVLTEMKKMNKDEENPEEEPPNSGIDWYNIADKALDVAITIMKEKRDDRTMGFVHFYLSQTDNSLNKQEYEYIIIDNELTYRTINWDNWGVGENGLYLKQKRESHNTGASQFISLGLPVWCGENKVGVRIKIILGDI